MEQGKFVIAKVQCVIALICISMGYRPFAPMEQGMFAIANVQCVIAIVCLEIFQKQ
jgi:hypothetical protein